MTVIEVCFLLLFVTCAQGTECDVFDGNTLKCIFPNNVNSTRTDFTAYFYPSDNGYPELLIDCVWVGDRLECIQQEGFSCMRPVSNIAQIKLHTRFSVKTGKYKCIAEGVRHEDSKLCQYTNSQPEKKDESLHEDEQKYDRKWIKEKHSPNNHLDHEDKGSPPAAVGPVFGSLIFILIILSGILLYTRHISKKIFSSKLQCQRGNSLNSEAGILNGESARSYQSTDRLDVS
ncbi:uncharacterized protein LOC112567929 [Pomacea canaliculata]|uniref:uncharacterized protein LOC112567929 n=1 Tax=Pomacea canaliculata TaxID=400727 RepID=UPI000D732EED|nr:uncharacterized protein LOC112567929 [Pomacea canaliculata]